MPVPLIVCETTTDWTVTFRWALPAASVRVETTADWLAIYELLPLESAAIVALEATLLGLQGSVRAIREARDRRPRAMLVALLDRGQLAWEPWLWEAGAGLVLTSPRDLNPAARLVQRYLEQTQPAATSLRDAVWQRMPWADAGTT